MYTLKFLLHAIIAPPAPKRRKKKGTSTAEKVMDKAMEAFMKYQNDSEERFMKAEDERWKKEIEYEERRRKEDREHEMRIMQMMMHMQNYSGPTNYEENYGEY